MDFLRHMLGQFFPTRSRKAMKPYLELIRGLPRPTPDQTANFAGFVASAHSWYKHLPPFPPGRPFTFFLDPNAGRDQIVHPGGSVTFADRIDKKKAFHYTWMTTATYRERFGHWAYTTVSGTRLFHGTVGGDMRAVDTSSGSRVMGPAGWVPVPPALIEQGTCFLTAVIHELFRPEMAFNNFREPQGESIAGFVKLTAEHPDDLQVRTYLPLLALAQAWIAYWRGQPKLELDLELRVWSHFKDATHPTQFERYLRQFPAGIYAALAKRKIAKLRGEPLEERSAEAKEQEKREAEEVARREAEVKAELEAEKARPEAERAKKEEYLAFQRAIEEQVEVFHKQERARLLALMHTTLDKVLESCFSHSTDKR